MFKAICDKVVEKEIEWINSNEIKDFISDKDISEGDLYDSLEILSNNYLIEGSVEYGGRIEFFKLTTFGFEIFAKYFFPEYEEITRKVLISIVNESSSSNSELSEELNTTRILIDFALDSLELLGYCKLSKTVGGNVGVHSISIEAKRLAGELSD